MALRQLVTACLALIVAGCASPATTDKPAPAEPTVGGPQEWSVTGEYDALVVNGDRMGGTGGEHAFDVAEPGWSDVLLTFEVHVETTLVLFPPGCDDPRDTCAQRFGPLVGSTQRKVGSMEPGTWRTAMELQASAARYGGSAYTLTLEGTLGPAA